MTQLSRQFPTDTVPMGGGYGRNWNGAPQGSGMMYWTDQDGNPVNAAEYEEVTVEGTLVLEAGTHPYIEEGRREGLSNGSSFCGLRSGSAGRRNCERYGI